MKIFLALLLVVSPVFIQEALSCVCSDEGIHVFVDDAKYIFIGKVKRVTKFFERKRYKDLFQDVHVETNHRVEVEEYLKGGGKAEVDLFSDYRSSCEGPELEVGKTYLVFASKGEKGQLVSWSCGLTHELEGVCPDLYFIRKRLRGERFPRIYGYVWAGDSVRKFFEPIDILAGVRVFLKGKNYQFESVTNELGIFYFDNIPDGEYEIKPVVDSKFKWRADGTKIRVEKDRIYGLFGGLEIYDAFYAQFSVSWDNGFTGKLFDRSGTIIKRYSIGLATGSSKPTYFESDDVDFYSLDNEFSWYGVMPGTHWSFCSLRIPFSNRSKESFMIPCHVKGTRSNTVKLPRKGRHTIDFELPEDYLAKNIKGKVVWDDGTPVDDALVALQHYEQLNLSNFGYESCSDREVDAYDCAKTNERGEFSLQGFEGAIYWLNTNFQYYLNYDDDNDENDVPKVVWGKPLRISNVTSISSLEIILKKPKDFKKN